MAAIVLIGFRGERPRVIPRMLEGMAAQAAVNARLDDGALTPTRMPLPAGVAGGSDHQTIYKWGDDWLSWAGIVHAVPGPVATERLYYTGDEAPKMRVGSDVYDLALPRPIDPIVATLGGVGTGDVVTRLYVYTWVTSFGEESEPCAASNEIDWQTGNSVTLSAFALPPADRAITKQRIYRSQTGQSGTYFYLIHERDADDADWADTVPVDEFQEPLPSADWNEPPDDLTGLTAMPNGMMVAFSGRELCFCEPWYPHAWPEKYRVTMDSDIMGLGVLGTTVTVLTKANPYTVQGTHPATMVSEKSKLNLPCTNARGIVDLGFGIAYPSNEGLALIRADGGAGLASEPLFGRDEWLKLNPTTLIGAQHKQRYVAFVTPTDKTQTEGALVMDLGADPSLSRDSARACAVHYDIPSGGLFFVRKGSSRIDRFDDPSGPRQALYWRSKVFALPYEDNFSCIRIDADRTLSGSEAAAYQAIVDAIIAANQVILDDGPIDGEVNGAEVNLLPVNGDILTPIPTQSGYVAVSVFANGTLVKVVSVTNRPVRLPSGFKARDWEIAVAGDLSVSKIVMARTMDELREV